MADLKPDQTDYDDARTAALERTLAMADAALATLVQAYEANDMQAVERMLASMALRRSQLPRRNTPSPSTRPLH